MSASQNPPVQISSAVASASNVDGVSLADIAWLESKALAVAQTRQPSMLVLLVDRALGRYLAL